MATNSSPSSSTPLKLLCLDYGQARVGLAIGDTSTNIALGKGVLEGLTQNRLIAKIKAIVNLEHIDRVIIGLPLNMAGAATAMTDEVQRFVEKLRNHLTIPVQTLDERLTSQMADRLIVDLPKDQRKQDQVAAQIILQNYLDQLAH
ncbi:MAG: Holliday junction resolvase RuvX [Candidatus Kerfeldbacteria bacterium]|nr:Holliday junction resolvase RuvX [Candidatus Kerfeldbacteria bacterium]